jgi:hypothetical protein
MVRVASLRDLWTIRPTPGAEGLVWETIFPWVPDNGPLGNDFVILPPVEPIVVDGDLGDFPELDAEPLVIEVEPGDISELERKSLSGGRLNPTRVLEPNPLQRDGALRYSENATAEKPARAYTDPSKNAGPQGTPVIRRDAPKRLYPQKGSAQDVRRGVGSNDDARESLLHGILPLGLPGLSDWAKAVDALFGSDWDEGR